MEPTLVQKEGGNPSCHDPENAQLLQAHYASHLQSARQKEEDDRPRERMTSPKRLLTTLIFSFLVTFGLAAVVVPRNGMPCHDVRSHQDAMLAAEGQGPLPESGSKSFSELVNTVSPHSLHRILSTYLPNRYKHGIFESEHRAMEAVHADDAALATTLVKIAKRQDSSNSTSTSPTDTSTGSASSSTTTTPIETPTTTLNTRTTTTTPEPTTTTPSNTPTSPSQTPSTPTPPGTFPTSAENPPSPSSSSSSSSLQSPSPLFSSSSATKSSSAVMVKSSTRSEALQATTESPTTGTEKTTAAISSQSTSESHQTAASSTTLKYISSSSSSSFSVKPNSVTTISKTTSSSVSLKRTSTPVTATFTSTKPNGEVTVVTSTSFVQFNVPATSTGADGSLQTQGAAPAPRIPALAALAGAILSGLALV